MHVFADTETERFRAGCTAPPVVCMQYCVDDGPAVLMTKPGDFVCADGRSGTMRSGTGQAAGNEFPNLLASWLSGGATLVGHNIAYDLACLCALEGALLPLVFRAYRENRITDTMWRQKLADIGRGKYRGFQAKGGWVQLNYDLGSVGGRHGFRVNKDDPWRLYYGLLADVPLADWPGLRVTVPKLKDDAPDLDKQGQPIMVNLAGEDAIAYGLGDPVATRAAFVGQAQRYEPALLCDEFNQARKFWGLHLAEVWGLRTSLRGVLDLERGALARVDELGAMLQEGPSPLVRADGSRDTKAAQARIVAVSKEAGIAHRLTKGGAPCLDSDACNSSGDPLLEAYAEYSSMKKVLSNDVAALRKGMIVPVHTHFDLAETGRTTSAGPNVQNPRRLAGVRECFVPRGYTG